MFRLFLKSAVAMIVVPSSCYSLYLYQLNLPAPFDSKRYSLLAKYHINNGLKAHNVKEISFNMTKALNILMKQGFTDSSPEITTIRVFVAEMALEDPQFNSDIDFLKNVHEYLIKKPHIGIFSFLY